MQAVLGTFHNAQPASALGFLNSEQPFLTGLSVRFTVVLSTLSASGLSCGLRHDLRQALAAQLEATSTLQVSGHIYC